MFKQLKLRKQAQIDYGQARGTAHKALLQNAANSLRQQKDLQTDIVQSLRSEIVNLQENRDQKLKAALTNYLVQVRLTDIPGIGESRKADILRYIYRGQLTDLHSAHQVPGIGEQTQKAINQWIHANQQKFPQLLRENFPGREEVDSWYHQALSIKEQKIASAQEKIQTIQAQLDPIQVELQWLERVTAEDFYRALKQADAAPPRLDDYIQGVFAEWEAVPDWFRDALAKADSRQLPGVIYKEGLVDSDIDSGSSSIYQGDLQKNYIVAIVVIILFTCCGFFAALTTSSDIKTTVTMTATARTETALPATTTPLPSATAFQSRAAEPPRRTPTPTATASATATPTATATPQLQVQVIVNGANVRESPDATADVVGVVRGGDILTVVQVNEAETWFEVELPDGRQAWIGSSVVSPVNKNTEIP